MLAWSGKIPGHVGAASDLAVAVSVDAGRDQHVHRHHPAALADLEHEGVGGHERERPGPASSSRQVRNSSIGQISPVAFEMQHCNQTAAVQEAA